MKLRTSIESILIILSHEEFRVETSDGAGQNSIVGMWTHRKGFKNFMNVSGIMNKSIHIEVQVVQLRKNVNLGIRLGQHYQHQEKVRANKGQKELIGSTLRSPEEVFQLE
jgi:hypothetical protein